MGIGVSFKVAPGVRVRASSRGLRASVGPRAARVHVGAGRTRISSGFGPLTVSTALGPTRTGRTGGTSRPRSVTLADLERQGRAAHKAEQRAQVIETEFALTNLHLEHFSPAQAPAIPEPDPPTGADVQAIAQTLRKQALKGVSVFDRSRRQAITADCKLQAHAAARAGHLGAVIRAQLAQAQAEAAWQALLAHDPEHVVAAVDDAFADNASTSTCVDAGQDPTTGQRYLSCLVMYGTPEMVPDTVADWTPGGKPTVKKRTKTDRNTVYLAGLAATAIATANEALAVSPATDYVNVLVLRTGPGGSIEAIATTQLRRPDLATADWSARTPADWLTRHGTLTINLKGQTREVTPLTITDPATSALLHDISASTASIR